ncbi:MAG: hypothetical protein WCC08_11140, partial [Terrimicrobiaceae bacterium]
FLFPLSSNDPDFVVEYATVCFRQEDCGPTRAGASATAPPELSTLGSSMKGVLWEVLAVPEIRVQAERLARLLLDGDHPRGDASSTHAR